MQLTKGFIFENLRQWTARIYESLKGSLNDFLRILSVLIIMKTMLLMLSSIIFFFDCQLNFEYRSDC